MKLSELYKKLEEMKILNENLKKYMFSYKFDDPYELHCGIQKATVELIENEIKKLDEEVGEI